MPTRRTLFFSAAAAALFPLGCKPGEAPGDATAWVGRVLRRMLSVQPGMTRDALLAVFTTEGGIANAWQQTYVSRDCPYFKVNVRFRPVSGLEPGTQGRGLRKESGGDVIASISPPYLEDPVVD